MEFIDEMEFDRLGVFTYSAEEDTPAASMPEQVDEEVKKDRQAELMELQQDISLDKGNEKIGRDMLVMIEGKVADENAYVGRTYGRCSKCRWLYFCKYRYGTNVWRLMSGSCNRSTRI